MDAANFLVDLYSEINSLIQDGQIDTPWTPLFELSNQLHKLLLCHKCDHLITDPYEIKRAKCRHLVCKGCISAFSECKPCSSKPTRVEECKELNSVVSGYRVICKYIQRNAFFRDSVGRDCTNEKLLFISRVNEAAGDLETPCTISLSNGIHEHTFNNAASHHLEPLQCQEEAQIKCSGPGNLSVTKGENFTDCRSNSFFTTPVTPKECVALQEAVTQEFVSEIDFASSKEINTGHGLVCAESSKIAEDLISSNEIVNQELVSEESDFTDELMLSDEGLCSEGLVLKDVNSEYLVSSKESENSTDLEVSSNEVLEMEVGALKESSTSNMLQISSEQLGASDEVSMEGPLSSNGNIVEGLISTSEVVNVNQSVPSEELNPSNDIRTMEEPVSLNLSNDLEAMEMSVFSEELNYSKDKGINGELMSSPELNGFSDVETTEELVISKEFNPSINLDVMDMAVFSEKFHASNDIRTKEESKAANKLNVINNVDVMNGLESSNELNDITKEGLNSSKKLNAYSETAEQKESSKKSNNSNDVTKERLMSLKALNAFNDGETMNVLVSSKESDDITKEVFMSSKELHTFNNVAVIDGLVSSKELSDSIDSMTTEGLMSSKELMVLNEEEIMEGLAFSKELKDSNDMIKEGLMSSQALHSFNRETIEELVSSKDVKGSDIMQKEGFMSSKEWMGSNGMTKEGLRSLTDVNTFNDEETGKDNPRDISSLNDINIIAKSLSSKRSNSLNKSLTSNETVTREEFLSLSSSDVSIENEKIGENLGASQNFVGANSNDEMMYFSCGPSTSASVKRKLEDLCEKPFDNGKENSINDSFTSRCSSPEIECTFSTLEIKNLDHCGCSSAEKQLGQISCHEITCPCYLNDRACSSQCFCTDCRNPNDPANAKLKKFIMQNVYRKYGFLSSDVNCEAGQQSHNASNLKTAETLRKNNFINLKNTIEAVKLNVGKFRQKPPIINCNPSSNNPELFDFSRANIQRFLFKGYGASGEKPGFVFNQSPSGKIVREPNRELWRRIDLINRKAIEQATVNPALIAYYIDLNSQPASGPSHQNVIKRV